MSKKSPQKHSPKQSQQVRIIGGEFRRRQISFVCADGLRPTPDRLRETLFNWLMGDLLGAKVLDVCAGSGVLGFEALSRGADFCVFIEKNSAQFHCLKATAQALNIEHKSQLIHHDALAVLKGDVHTVFEGCFDVVFVDPPYDSGLYEPILNALITHQHISSSSLIYMEHDAPLESLAQRFNLDTIKSTKVGQIHAGIFQTSTQPTSTD